MLSIITDCMLIKTGENAGELYQNDDWQYSVTNDWMIPQNHLCYNMTGNENFCSASAGRLIGNEAPLTRPVAD